MMSSTDNNTEGEGLLVSSTARPLEHQNQLTIRWLVVWDSNSADVIQETLGEKQDHGFGTIKQRARVGVCETLIRFRT
jgi:hypothetical protein